MQSQTKSTSEVVISYRKSVAASSAVTTGYFEGRFHACALAIIHKITLAL